MKTFLKTMTFFVSFGLASQASAGLLLEPYLGYESSTLTLDDGSVDSGGKGSGLGFGARLGYKTPIMIWVAADYSSVSGATYKGAVSTNDGKIDSTNLFVDVGVDLPILFRLWAGYGVQSKSKFAADSGAGGDIIYESPLKVGIGLTALPLVSINVEYFTAKVKEIETGGSTTQGSFFKTSDNKGLVVSVSAPFNF